MCIKYFYVKIFHTAKSILLLGDFTLYFTPSEACVLCCIAMPEQSIRGTHVLWRVLFIVPLRYLFAIGFHCKCAYKAPIFSLWCVITTTNYLSCSPKQLDSGAIIATVYFSLQFSFIYSVCVCLKMFKSFVFIKTWLSHSMAVIKYHKCCFPARKRCVFC